MLMFGRHLVVSWVVSCGCEVCLKDGLLVDLFWILALDNGTLLFSGTLFPLLLFLGGCPTKNCLPKKRVPLCFFRVTEQLREGPSHLAPISVIEQLDQGSNLRILMAASCRVILDRRMKQPSRLTWKLKKKTEDLVPFTKANWGSFHVRACRFHPSAFTSLPASAHRADGTEDGQLPLSSAPLLGRKWLRSAGGLSEGGRQPLAGFGGLKQSKPRGSVLV